MVVKVKCCEIEITIVEYHQYLVFIKELSQQLSVFIVVQAIHIRVIPHLTASESRVAMTLQTDTMNWEFCQKISLRSTSFDHDVGEVFFCEYLLQFRIRVKCDLYYLCLTIGIGSEVHHL